MDELYALWADLLAALADAEEICSIVAASEAFVDVVDRALMQTMADEFRRLQTRTAPATLLLLDPGWDLSAVRAAVARQNVPPYEKLAEASAKFESGEYVSDYEDW